MKLISSVFLTVLALVGALASASEKSEPAGLRGGLAETHSEGRHLAGTWTDGTVCIPHVSCTSCTNTYTYWPSLQAYACGADSVPCWSDSTTCVPGTTCNACCNEASYWAGAVATKCGLEPCWGDGTTCGAETTCSSCCNGDSFWVGAAAQKCGPPEPCWGVGTTCGTGTTCHACCTGNGNANCPWWHFGICTCG